MRYPSARHAAVAALVVLAGTGAAQDFPADATAPTAEQLSAALGGKAFDVAPADGTRWRLEFKSNGYFFININNGFNGSGEWRAEDGKLCTRLQGRDAAMTCNEARLSGAQVLARRTTGEMIRYVPR